MALLSGSIGKFAAAGRGKFFADHEKCCTNSSGRKDLQDWSGNSRRRAIVKSECHALHYCGPVRLAAFYVLLEWLDCTARWRRPTITPCVTGATTFTAEIGEIYFWGNSSILGFDLVPAAHDSGRGSFARRDLEARPAALLKTKSFPPTQPEIELSVASPKFFNTTSDRRQYPRTKLAEIAYIGMGPENGGLVLDVSDGGLSFHAVAPVQQSETIRFLLSLRGHSRIEGSGEVVWTNEMRTVCGLRFTSLSSGAREHLNNWTNQSKIPTVPRKRPVAAGAQALAEAKEIAPMAPMPQFEARPPSVFAIRPTVPVFLPAPESDSPARSPLLVWGLVIVLGIALAVGAFSYGVRVGKLQAGPLSPTAGVPSASFQQSAAPSETNGSLENAEPQQSDSVTEPSAKAGSSETPENSPAIALPNTAASQRPMASSLANALSAAPGIAPASASGTNTPAANKSDKSALDAQAQQEAGKSQLASALAYLNGDAGRRDSAKAVQQLWAAVRNGNTEAEVVLSDLFITGDGVGKSCEQARVLLTAAAKNGNAQARLKLDELNSSGCD